MNRLPSADRGVDRVRRPGVRLKTMLLVIGASVPTLIACSAGDSESWQYGYEQASSAAGVLDWGISLEYACGLTVKFAAKLANLDPEEAVAGCVEGVKDASK